jgi:hypothetical protein
MTIREPGWIDSLDAALITLKIRQAGGHDPVAERLAAIPEVLEVHAPHSSGQAAPRLVSQGKVM